LESGDFDRARQGYEKAFQYIAANQTNLRAFIQMHTADSYMADSYMKEKKYREAETAFNAEATPLAAALAGIAFSEFSVASCRLNSTTRSDETLRKRHLFPGVLAVLQSSFSLTIDAHASCAVNDALGSRDDETAAFR
jgi:hypothetical protein